MRFATRSRHRIRWPSLSDDAGWRWATTRRRSAITLRLIRARRVAGIRLRHWGPKGMSRRGPRSREIIIVRGCCWCVAGGAPIRRVCGTGSEGSLDVEKSRDDAARTAPALALVREQRQVRPVHLGHDERHVVVHAESARVREHEPAGARERRLHPGRRRGVERREDDRRAHRVRAAPQHLELGDGWRQVAREPSRRAACRRPAERFDAATSVSTNHGCAASSRTKIWPTAPAAPSTATGTGDAGPTTGEVTAGTLASGVVMCEPSPAERMILRRRHDRRASAASPMRCARRATPGRWRPSSSPTR